uniref:CSON004787 protein n=1 Tax=Culicoides sonorensis TaxID=179676 RepID=A0A336LU43_CULSO
MIKHSLLLILFCLANVSNAQNWLNYFNQFNPSENIGNVQSVTRTTTTSTTTEPPITDSSETIYNYPCNGEIVQMTRPGGKLTPETNYWDGRVDLTDFVYLKSIKIVIMVDQAAKITIEPEVGYVSGPKTGKVFRVTYNGAPPDVNEINFHIKGLQGTLFPNLVSLHLNNREICSNPTSVIDNLTGTLSNLGNVGNQLTGGLGETLGSSLGLGGLFGSSGNNFNTNVRPTQTTTIRTTTTKRANIITASCGRRQITQSAYITNGWEVRPGDYPWHAALYHKGTSLIRRVAWFEIQPKRIVTKNFSIMFIKFIIILILCGFYANCSDSTDEDGEVKYDYFYPCGGQDFIEMTKPQGEVTHETNWWNCRVNLAEFTYLKAIKLVIRVDQLAKIYVDEQDGIVTGPKTGKVFRVTFYGTPAEVPEVRFKVEGTMGTFFPNLVKLHLNNRDICMGALTTTTPRPKPTKTVRTTTTKPPVTKKGAPAPTCGTRQVKQSAYITNGWEVRPGDYPWHAALFHKGSRSSSYKCGGTLINKQTVITAAHCLYSNGRQIIPEKVSIQLGKHNLNVFDSNTVEYQVFRLIIHPEYSPIDLQDDLALVRLETVVEFTQFIFPACLWKAEKKSLDNVIGKKGTVVGWGLTEDDGLAEILNAGTMPVVSFIDCLESDRDFFGPFLSDFNYCAGYRNGTSVCNGDSGGGMFFQENGLWTLRGLVSFSSVREDRDVCNPKNYVIFTDVAKYLDWIEKNI